MKTRPQIVNKVMWEDQSICLDTINPDKRREISEKLGERFMRSLGMKEQSKTTRV